MDTFELVRAILIVAAAYLIGGIPWGIIVARLTGRTDPRTIGSGRTGGANAMRALGRRLALLSGILDLLKGTAAVLLARWLGAGVEVEVVRRAWPRSSATAAPRSSASAAGAASPRRSAGCSRSRRSSRAIIIPLFIVVIAITRYSSLGSLTASAAAGVLLAGATAVLGWDPWLYVYAVGGTALVWLFHLDNIQRLLAGTERKIGTPADGGSATDGPAGGPGADGPRRPAGPPDAATRGASRPSPTR